MSRVMTVSTLIGLAGLILAMVTPLIGVTSSVLLGLAFGMVALGLFGAVIGAIATLSHAWQAAR